MLACIHSLSLVPRTLAKAIHSKLSAPPSDFIHSIALYLAAFPYIVHTHTGAAAVCHRFSNGKEDWAEQYRGLRLRFQVPCCWSFSPVSFSNLKMNVLTAIECLSCFLARFLFVKTVTSLINHSFKLFKAWQIPVPLSSTQTSLCYILLASRVLIVESVIYRTIYDTDKQTIQKYIIFFKIYFKTHVPRSYHCFIWFWKDDSNIM